MNNIGLSDEEVLKSREQYGSNIIISKKRNTFFRLFIESLGDPMIKILLIVLAIKIVFLFREFDWFETLGILIAIFLASFISSVSEYGSNKAFEKLLEKNNLVNVKVRRNGKLVLVNIEDIVVGDIVYLSNGDYIPVDGYIIDGDVLVDESNINGESLEVPKTKYIDNIQEKNKLYKGSLITANECVMKVENVGIHTMYGMIATELQSQAEDSPLKIRLKHLAKIISRIGYIGAFLVFFSYLFSVLIIANNFNINAISNTLSDIPLLINHLVYALTLCVTIIIVSVPEGLPMMVALVLSTNMKRMLKNNVLVRKLVGIETAGSLNVLLTDKTGTITNGYMMVSGIVSADNKVFYNEIDLLKYPVYYDLIGNSVILNNECKVSDNKLITGNSTDKALYNFMSFVCIETIQSKEIFDSIKKYSSVTTKNKTYFKGASEVILPKCSHYIDLNGNKLKINNRMDISNIIGSYMQKGYRVIALAINDKSNKLENLTYIGCVIIKDTIRDDSKEGLDLIKKAGIHVIMVTGDSLDTAYHIAQELKMLNNESLCITSTEFNNMADEEIKHILPKLVIVARAKPNDKSRLVKIIKEMNLVVGMTGDGVNDAPALKKCDVGFAMGSGTEVAKEASDIVILDDHLKSISLAILFGRTIFKNIRKFLIFQLTVNICAMSLSIIGPFIGIQTPVTVMQMLWINMIMDTLAGLAFAYEEPHFSYMNESPKTKHEPIINKYMYGEILFTGIYSAILCLLFLKSNFIHEFIRFDVNNKYFLTAFFTLFIFIGIFNAFNTRTNKFNLFYRISTNKMFIVVFSLVSIIELYLIYFGGDVFRTYGLNIQELLLVIILAFSVIPIDMLRKYYLYKKNDYEYI